MKEGKSITQFPRQELLTGDELFLVNQIQSNGRGYISRYITLDALRDYILSYTPIPSEEAGKITEVIPESSDTNGETIYEFVTAGEDYTETLSAGTWKYTIVGGGGNFFNFVHYQLLTIGRVTQKKYSEPIYYQGGSSPMLIGTFTLSEPTQCKFHVGDKGTITRIESK